jgi:phosphate transport system protein
LQDEVLLLGSEVEENLVTAVTALVRRDVVRSQRVIAADRGVNERQLALTMDSLKLIATQQPAASDLRLLASVMNIANELERIHDYVKGTGKVSLMIGENSIPIPLTTEFPIMAEKTRFMLHRALDAFVRRDAALARQVVKSDDEIDELFNESLKKISNAFSEGVASFEQLNWLGWVNHNLERSADRVCNICEWVVYTATGHFEELN